MKLLIEKGELNSALAISGPGTLILLQYNSQPCK